MTRPSPVRSQQGATLVVGLIMLVLITLMVTTALTMSTANLKAVGNMQFRNEAIAAANVAIEQSFGVSPFPTPYNTSIDINQDSASDYSVSLTRTCLRSTNLSSTPSSGSGSSVSLGFSAAVSEYLVFWDYDASVTDSTTGSSARVHQGIRQRLNQSQCDALCPPAPSTPCS